MRSHANGTLKNNFHQRPIKQTNTLLVTVGQLDNSRPLLCHSYTYRSCVNSTKMSCQELENLSVVHPTLQRTTCSPQICLPWICKNCQPQLIMQYYWNSILFINSEEARL